MRFLPLPLLALLACLSLSCASSSRGTRASGPWKLDSLFQPPAATWGARTGLVQEVYYAGEPFEGKPTRVFAYVGRPTNAPGSRVPAMVLVHGGGGRAFAAWAEHWARRGYAALAMDLAGNGPDGRLADGGPDQSDAVKFRHFTEDEIGDMWSYHAVAAVIRGHSLLRTLPEVDTSRTGLTGISWGGYLTCIVAGLDSRFKVAVPVYGCGFLGDNSFWKDRSLASMTPEARKLWLSNFDPGRYLRNASCPMLFVNGTTDFAYPLDSYQKSYRRVPEALRSLCIVTNLPHGHIWTFPEVDTFVDSVLEGAPSLPKLGPTEVSGNTVEASVTSPLELRDAVLCYTTDDGPWPSRTWRTVPARIEAGRVLATLPTERPRVLFFLVWDTRGLRASSEHTELVPVPPGHHEGRVTTKDSARRSRNQGTALLQRAAWRLPPVAAALAT